VTDLYSESTEFYSTEQEINLPTGNVALTACYEAMTQEERDTEWMTPVRINEVSADNNVYVNDIWKRSDWVELVNTTDNDIDIEGMYLSDDETKPKKWRISADGSQASTIIPARGHLIVWCDKQEPVCDLHASFKISNDGGVMLLSSADESWTDRLPYPAHDGNSTVGRYPDGCGDIYLMTPTIGGTNRLTSYDTLYMSGETGITAPAIATIGNMRMGYALGTLTVRGVKGSTCHIELYTLSGQKVRSLTTNMTDGTATCMVETATAGCYIARATDSEGRTCTCKFIVN
jgi:hypothetical protein